MRMVPGRAAAALLVAGMLVQLPGGVAAQRGEGASVTGRVVDEELTAPVENVFVQLQGSRHRVYTDSVGIFIFHGVEPGSHVITVEHLAYGTQVDTLDVPESGNVDLNIRIATAAIELDPVVVQVLSREELARRARGTAVNVVTRQDLTEAEGTSQTFGQVLEAEIPGIRSIRTSPYMGIPECVEFRRPLSLLDPQGCHPPLVVVDGARIQFAEHFLSNVPLSHIESAEVLSAAEAGTKYGTGSGHGVILVESRRPWRPSEAEGSAERAIYNWNLEPGKHSWARTLGGAALGTIGGLSLVMGASGDCSPLNELRLRECPGVGSHLAGVAAFTLPVLGAAAGANLLGRTRWSQGRFKLNLLLSAVPMFTGYFFATPREEGRAGFASQKIFGRTIVAVGVPLVATLADRFLRTFTGGRVPGGR